VDILSLEHVHTYGIQSAYVEPAGDARTFNRKILDVFTHHHVDLVLVIGYTRIVPSTVADAYRGRMLVVHPSLVPTYMGDMDIMRVHRNVLDSDAEETGCTVYIGTGDRIAVQNRCSVNRVKDTPLSLNTKVQQLEAEALMDAVNAYSSGTLLEI
jgi:phosphoribosylglycinamide formyltransferase-1